MVPCCSSTSLSTACSCIGKARPWRVWCRASTDVCRTCSNIALCLKLVWISKYWRHSPRFVWSSQVPLPGLSVEQVRCSNVHDADTPSTSYHPETNFMSILFNFYKVNHSTWCQTLDDMSASSLMWPLPNSCLSVARVAAYNIFSRTYIKARLKRNCFF